MRRWLTPCILIPLLCESSLAQHRTLQLKVPVRSEWVPLPSTAASSSWSALRILRAFDLKTGKAYDPSMQALGVDPRHLQRSFRLDQRRVLLGEPILVGLRIELNGPGRWSEPVGGNYRARGRDDNFFFLLQRAKGGWVPDPYAPIIGYMGGILSAYHVIRGRPMTYWFAVQRWAALTRPGRYVLHCFHLAHDEPTTGMDAARRVALAGRLPGRQVRLARNGQIIDRSTGRPLQGVRAEVRIRPAPSAAVSPLLRRIPAAVVKRVRAAGLGNEVIDYARYRLDVVRGTAAERRRMVQRWTQLVAQPGPPSTMPTSRVNAAREAIRFARQDDFVGLIGFWHATPNKRDPDDLVGLAMRSSPRAVKLLLGIRTPYALNAMRYLRGPAIRRAIPLLIGYLTNGNHEIRAMAEQQLRLWTGQAFLHTWKGYHYKRPTLAEGRSMQPAWRAWWKQARARFRPPGACGPRPCSKQLGP